MQQCRREIYTVLYEEETWQTDAVEKQSKADQVKNQIKKRHKRGLNKNKTPMWIKINLATTPSIGRYEKKKNDYRSSIVNHEPSISVSHDKRVKRTTQSLCTP